MDVAAPLFPPFLLFLSITLVLDLASAANCTNDNIKITQTQVSRGKHPKWRMEVLNTCEICEATIVEVVCPGWVEPKSIEGYMYPVELVDKDLCMLGGPVLPTRSFSYVYRQPAGKIDLRVSSVRYSCAT